MESSVRVDRGAPERPRVWTVTVLLKRKKTTAVMVMRVRSGRRRRGRTQSDVTGEEKARIMGGSGRGHIDFGGGASREPIVSA